MSCESARSRYRIGRVRAEAAVPERFLLVDPGPLAGEALDRVLSPRSWYVTQGDSDIDRPERTPEP
jgi:hypothetical protein